jgi:hypothetical protein
MIDRNLGNIERLVRLVFGIALAVFAFMQPQITLTETFVLIAALSLILNGVFSRCFLWWALGINTLKPHPSECHYSS